MSENQKNDDDFPVQTKFIEERVITATGEIAMRRYQRGKFLGKGGFARCYEFINLDSGKTFAAKIVPKLTLKRMRAKQKLMSEIKIHRSVSHQNVVNFEHFFEDSENVYMLLELCSNQTMSELLRRRKRLTELEVQCYLIQITQALKYLHEHKIIHRDLKLGNLFLSEKMEVKLGDFGLATVVAYEGEKKRTICGTPNYIAPEILDSQQGHSYEVDVWSLGVIVYTLLVGRPPFETADVKSTYRKIKLNVYGYPDHISLSEQVKGLISRILISDPSKRPSLDEILANDFLNQGNSIPKFLPSSTLACPPSSMYLRQFQLHPVPTQTERWKDTIPLVPVSRADRRGVDTDRKRVFSHLCGIEAASSCAQSSQGPSVWVKQWVDYSSKYGLGYELNTEAVGVFFNDSTKIVLMPNGHEFHYIEKLDDKETVLQYFLTDYPKELQKKVTLLQHFRSYMDTEMRQNTVSPDSDESGHEVVYVRKWMKTKHAVLFRLSCKVVQVNFQDSTQLVLSSATKMVTYLNKQHESTTYHLDVGLETSNADLAKRLKYTKDLLSHMLNEANRGSSDRQKEKKKME